MLNSKKSKLENIRDTGKWKELYKFELEFSDGTVGTIYRQKEHAGVDIGTEYDFTINDKNTIKIVDPNKPQNYDTPSDNQAIQKYIVRQSSLKSSVDFWKPKIEKGIECCEADIVLTAQIFEEYVLLNKKPEKLPF